MAAGADIQHQPRGVVTRRIGRLDALEQQQQPQQEEQATAAGGAAGKPPRPVFTTTTTTTTTTITTCLSGSGSAKCVKIAMTEESATTRTNEEQRKNEFVPVIRSGGWTDIGTKLHMEDAHVRIDDLGPRFAGERPGAFYGVFDGHGGKQAAQFARERLLGFILEDASFPASISDAVRHAFLQADNAFAEACIADEELSSGTTAITAIVSGRTLIVANAGDCRAVLSRRGRAVDMSRDHKPDEERSRIEAGGGFVDDGYLNGQLAVARALGDWHMQGLKHRRGGGPLISDPELRQAVLSEEDEFLIIGCDGLWDVFTSQNAVDIARRELQLHNDPERASEELVREALRRDTRDNLTVVTVCFHAGCPPRLAPGGVAAVRRSFSAEGLRNLQDLLDSC